MKKVLFVMVMVVSMIFAGGSVYAQGFYEPIEDAKIEKVDNGYKCSGTMLISGSQTHKFVKGDKVTLIWYMRGKTADGNATKSYQKEFKAEVVKPQDNAKLVTGRINYEIVIPQGYIDSQDIKYIRYRQASWCGEANDSDVLFPTDSEWAREAKGKKGQFAYEGMIEIDPDAPKYGAVPKGTDDWED